MAAEERIQENKKTIINRLSFLRLQTQVQALRLVYQRTCTDKINAGISKAPDIFKIDSAAGFCFKSALDDL